MATSAYCADVVEIEEHWQLQVGGPDSVKSSPQVTMVMSPKSHLDGEFFVLTLNHRSYPDFTAGGIQVQRWCGEECIAAKDSPAMQALNRNDETISWVQRISLTDELLTFEVLSGASQSWGAFGASGKLKLSKETNLARLNSYKPAISLGESGIGYAGNRVSSLTLTKLRWKTADGNYHEMVAPIDIDTDLDP